LRSTIRQTGAAAVAAVVCLVLAKPAMAQPAAGGATVPAEIAAQLNGAQLQAYQAHLAARAVFDRQFEAYWATVEERRDGRRKKRAAGQRFQPDDYVTEQPPKYAGPPLPPEVARILAARTPPTTEKPMAGVRDFLDSARTTFGFVPSPTTEREFKRRYAVESLAAGLSKTQVVRVYALETGGQGTIDMQAGIDPITKSGKPISSALGYAQLLHANSISELVKHGETFLQRLAAMAAQPGLPSEQVAALGSKSVALRRMLAMARSVPNEWREHQRLAQTPQGQGIHALNLDADIGPWLQVLKLRGLLTTASQEAGRTQLTGAELELMNLAGPRTGLEMMEPVARGMPTANFFSQGGYYRNTIVREKTAAQLLAALDERMNVNVNKPGAIEFATVFDEVMAAQGITERPAGKAADDPIAALLNAMDSGR
jgi:hypothetical protein